MRLKRNLRNNEFKEMYNGKYGTFNKQTKQNNEQKKREGEDFESE